MARNTATTGVKGSRKKIVMDGDFPEVKPMESKEKESGAISIQEFVDKQKDFMLAKKLEGLAGRTMTDYVNHFQYVNNWISEEYTDSTVTSDRYIEKGLFMGYVGHMISQFKPSTVNIRLRTLRCYLKWLYSEGLTKEDISTKLKLVKVPKDTIQPLSPSEVKKIFKVLDLSSYADYRDFCIMLVMLETGVRVNEASNIMLSDVNRKLRLLTVRSETSKTREERHLPVSAKTMKYLERLITIAKANGELHLFNSTLGGRVATMTIIKNFDKYGKRAGINSRCTPHIYRHTMAVNSVKAGMDIFTLQKLLGHANITTTRQYIQLNTDDLISSHSKVNVIERFI